MDDRAFIAEMFNRTPGMMAEPAPGAPAGAASAPAATDQVLVAEMFPNTPGMAKPADAEPTSAAAAGGGEQAETAAAADPLELDAPKGISADDPVFTDFRQVAGELGLDKDKAGRLVELHQRALAANQQAWDDQVGRWTQQIQADKEIGGERMKESIAAALEVTKRFGTPELQKVLDQPMYGSNPEIVRLLARVGRALRDGKG
ncbi:hypothetical protein [Anaeromyxobacter paludicola]|uniref:Uncharacterized protein n=1 Tax=Anaeromyxobacter paludicola TaxID=2918171 RepID=A0ABN6N4S9_9BACT|nr:hypothetical protein [Anaeromyxobacter paludicola]BDG06989.1 hypothetical protein AMPC_01020 [Anaeromyxobacter paludicola]